MSIFISIKLIKLWITWNKTRTKYIWVGWVTIRYIEASGYLPEGTKQEHFKTENLNLSRVSATI